MTRSIQWAAVTALVVAAAGCARTVRPVVAAQNQPCNVPQPGQIDCVSSEPSRASAVIPAQPVPAKVKDRYGTELASQHYRAPQVVVPRVATELRPQAVPVPREHRPPSPPRK